ELRSDKVRHIIGTRPPAAVRYGTLIVVAVMTLIIIAAAIIPYSPDGTTLLQRLLP
ncbi:HlyD family secretion protein, partial [Muribaculaceae bacterium Isolate-102 (HZI)]